MFKKLVQLKKFVRIFLSLIGERKTTKHKHFGGIVPGLGGVKKLFLCFFGPKFLWRRGNPSTKFQENPGTILGKFCLCVLFKLTVR